MKLIRGSAILLAALMTAALAFIPVQGALRLVLFLIPYLTVGYDILLRAGKGIWNRQLLDEVALYLLAKETITGDELMAYVNAAKAEVKEEPAAETDAE